MLRGLGTSIWNYFDLRSPSFQVYRELVALPKSPPKLTVMDHIAEVVMGDLMVISGDAHIYKNEGEDQLVGLYCVEYTIGEETIYESFDDPKEAASRFIQVVDNEV
jgi:hypothetical protein